MNEAKLEERIFYLKKSAQNKLMLHGGACMEGRGMHGRVGVEVCMVGVRVWQERQPLKWAVRIHLECTLVFQ